MTALKQVIVIVTVAKIITIAMSIVIGPEIAIVITLIVCPGPVCT